MKLHELYERDIDRRIDPVATVSELEEGYVRKEIEEYFFTDTLFEHLHTFLDLLGTGTAGRTGVWINGYYGSGKSHFLKYIYYCLWGEHSEAALDHFEESLRRYEGDPLDQPVTENEARTARRRLETLAVDPIMFNIKAVASDEVDEDSVTRIFYHRLNAFRGYHKSNIQIARFEKALDGQGKLAAFKDAYREDTGDDWADTASEAVDFALDSVLDAAGRVADIDPASTREALQREASVTTEEFVDELEQFVASKPEDYRLVYLVDEVSQFMEGRPRLLLDLQTIVEEIGDRLGDRVWVLATAQQELKELVENARQKQQADYSYGKIMSRFETYLPLESQQADLITKKRVLGKNPEGREHLRTFFAAEEEAIRNQFRLGSSDLYQGYDDAEEFVTSYPLVPYQFKLIVEVIRAFAQADYLVPGVSSTERSLIGLTHHVARSSKEEETGYFVPFDAFYNAPLSDHLTHRARSIINNALQLERVTSDPFAQRVVKALFLLSNIASDQRQNFPATTENIALSLVDEVDPTWAELKRQTQDVLDTLVGQNVLSESEGRYRFLEEEEIRVKREIDNHQITHHDRLETFAEEVIGEQLRWSNRADLDGTTVRMRLKVDDHEKSGSGAVGVQFLLYQSGEPEAIAIDRAKDELVFCLMQHVGPEQQQRIDEVVRIRSYLQDHLDSASGERLEAMNTFARQSKRTLSDLRRWFERAMEDAKYVSAQQVFDASGHNGQSAKARYEAIVEGHLRRVYDKRDLATAYAQKRSRLRELAAEHQMELDGRLTEAEMQVNSDLSLETHPTVDRLLSRYQQAPYGWKDTEVLHILLNLEARNKRTFKWNSEDVGRETFVEKAVNRQEQASVTIHEQEAVDPQLMHRTRQAINQNIFNERLVEQTTDPKQLAEAIRGQLEKKREQAAVQASDHRGRPFAKHFDALREALGGLRDHRDAAALFEAVNEQADALAEQVDRAQQLQDFWEQNGETYQAMQSMVGRHEANFSLLDATTQSRADKLARYVRSDTRPDEQFRSMLDYYEAARGALDEKVGEVRAATEAAYAEAFDRLEQRKDELDVQYELPDRSAQMDRIRRTDNLAALQNQLSTVSDFRAEYLAELNDAAQEDEPGNGGAPKQSEIFNVRAEISRHELETEEDVASFAGDLKEKLLQRVQDGKIVIIK